MRRDHPIARGEIGSKSPENPGEHLENPADLYWWMDECARRGGSIALTHRLALKQRDLTTYGTPGAARRRPVHKRKVEHGGSRLSEVLGRGVPVERLPDARGAGAPRAVERRLAAGARPRVGARGGGAAGR